VTRGDQIFNQIQKKARTDGVEARKQPPTAEYLTRHALESFLDRLTQTEHGKDFVLKGGILLAAYGARRPTKDVDAEAISSSVTADNIAQIVSDIAAVEADDGVEFDLGSLDIQEIREEAEYPGLRVRVNISIGTFSGKVLWDISTGDPIVPMPKMVKVPRVLGDDIEMLGYAPETVLAEKGVTILERGTTSTRWRDYVDIVRLAEIYDIDNDLLLASAQAVADYRGVDLKPVGSMLDGYGSISQPKWAAWRRKEGFEDICDQSLDVQVAAAAAVLHPVFARGRVTAPKPS
jgi:hypothetical protein